MRFFHRYVRRNGVMSDFGLYKILGFCFFLVGFKHLINRKRFFGFPILVINGE